MFHTAKRNKPLVKYSHNYFKLPLPLLKGAALLDSRWKDIATTLKHNYKFIIYEVLKTPSDAIRPFDMRMHPVHKKKEELTPDQLAHAQNVRA
jgi:hypothetical protein